jgi:hypothetical protein
LNITLSHCEKYCSEIFAIFGPRLSLLAHVYGYLLMLLVDGSDAPVLEGLSLAIVVDYLGIFP